MGRPRTATDVLERRGAFEKNPARGRARAGIVDSYFAVRRRQAFPPLPEAFKAVDGMDTPKKRRLRSIWHEIECCTGQVEIHEDNFEILDYVCELLWKCRYGRTATEEDRARARRWLAAFRMDLAYADRLVHREP